MEPLKVQVLIGSVRRGRYAERPAHWVMELLKERRDVQAELIDLKDWPLPFYDEPATPNSNKGVYEHPLGRKWADKIAEADAYVFIVAEYNHGPTAVLKNALDWVSRREWGNKPVAFVSYGSVSGARAVQQVRQNVLELGLVPMREAIHIPSDVKKATTAPEPEDVNKFEPLNERTNIMIDETLRFARLLRQMRAR